MAWSCRTTVIDMMHDLSWLKLSDRWNVQLVIIVQLIYATNLTLYIIIDTLMPPEITHYLFLR